MDNPTGVQGFKIKVFLDTNILCYLVDKTYDALQHFIKCLSQMPIVELVSSEYVLLEFIGVRKQESYFQEALNKARSTGKSISISSFLKYNKQYNIPNFSYEELKEKITKRIQDEESIIINDYGITFSCALNKNLLKPTRDICLVSRISKEDSLVLCSALYENDVAANGKIIILTNDKDFHNWYLESSQEIDLTLSSITKEKPQLEHIDNIHWQSGAGESIINLRNNISFEDVNQFAVDYIKNIFIKYYSEYYIGTTCTCPATAPTNCIGLKVTKACKNQIFIIFISKDLNLLYCSSHAIDMYHHNKSVGAGFSPQAGDDKVSFILNGVTTELLQKLQAPENLVFCHPDNA